MAATTTQWKSTEAGSLRQALPGREAWTRRCKSLGLRVQGLGFRV